MEWKHRFNKRISDVVAEKHRRIREKRERKWDEGRKRLQELAKENPSISV